ncbi:MAG: YCF48-related protein [Flavobacteriales bacterium]
MKSFLLFIAAFFSWLQSVGQWELVEGPVNQGDNYGGMSFVNDSTGFVVQRHDDWPIVRSLILKTEDFGANWDTVYSIVDTSNQWIPNFTDVFFINEQEGWVCGYNMPFVLHTVDGGLTWEQQSISSTEPLDLEDADFEIIKFYNNQYGVALNGFAGQHAIETFDGGEHWNVNDSLTGKGVSFIDECNYIISRGGPLLMRENCLINFQVLPTSESGSDPLRQGRDIHIADESAWIITTQGLTGFNNFGSIARTHDGGQTFEFLDLFFTNKSDRLNFFDELNGFVSLSPTNFGNEPCAIMRTNDGGLTWHCQETPLIEYLGNYFYTAFSDIECPSPEICYANSPNRIFRTFNGGGPLGTMWTSIEESASKEISELPQVYPNPASDFIQFTQLSPNIQYHLRVYDTTGRMVMQTTMDATNKVNIEQLSNGAYILELSSDKSQFQVRMFRQ